MNREWDVFRPPGNKVPSLSIFLPLLGKLFHVNDIFVIQEMYDSYLLTINKDRIRHRPIEVANMVIESVTLDCDYYF